ncbi:MAG: hypothetical protein RIR26_1372 [Pseudomonadota bacterium]|jgi:regulator of cell morphogenesis and NO signaling
MIASDASLSEIVTLCPAVAPVLDKLKIDYCCHGAMSLNEACQALGLDLQSVRDELVRVGNSPAPEGWAKLRPDALVAHIKSKHHAYLKRELPRLSTLAVKVHRIEGKKRPELESVCVCLKELEKEFDAHLAKEEGSLFPQIKHLSSQVLPVSSSGGTLQMAFSEMEKEHERVMRLLEHLRVQTNDFNPPGECSDDLRALYGGLAELEADTHLHVHKENNLLVPQVIEMESRLNAQAAS